MGFGRLALSAAGKVGIVLAVIVAFIFGMLVTVYLSLRTAEVKVPDVLTFPPVVLSWNPEPPAPVLMISSGVARNCWVTSSVIGIEKRRTH